MNTPKPDPHQGQAVEMAGVPIDRAKAAVILVHGRGAPASSMLAFSDELNLPEVAFLAPQAAGNAWYPYSFLAPLAANEPGLTSGLKGIGNLVEAIGLSGLPPERIMLLGFSQGACLVGEYAARHPGRYGGVVMLSGGLIGSADTVDGKRFDYDGSLDDTPVFLGCSDVDAHIPLERVRTSATVLRGLGGNVTERIYPGMAHTINEDELAYVEEQLSVLTS